MVRGTHKPLFGNQGKVLNLGYLDFDIVSDLDIRISDFASPRPSTTVENSLQISSFLTNKANFPDAQMNVNKVLTKDYENNSNWTLGENKPNTNPIQSQYKANSKPIQSQYKPNTNPTCRGVASGEAGSNPISEAKKSCCRGNPHAGRRAGTVARIKFVTVSLTSLGIDANLLALQFKEAELWNYPG